MIVIPSASLTAVAERVALAIANAWLLLVVELGLFTILHRAGLASIWELQFGTAWLAPTAFAMALAPAAIGGTLLWSIEHGGWSARVMLALALGGWAGIVAWGVSTGRHFQQPLARIGWTIACAAAAAAVAVLLAPLLSRARRYPTAFAATAAGLLVGVEAINLFVLVRLYPAFHAGLAGLALALAAGILPAWEQSGLARAAGRGLTVAVVGVLGIFALFVAKPAAKRLAYFDNLKLLLIEHAPLWGSAVRVASELAPPPPIGAVDCATSECAGDNESQATGGPSFVGRDIVLISIDALRADHVSAYGYDRPTTPHIGELARQAVVFEEAYCPTPHTSYSVTSLMTGKYIRPLLMQNAGEDSDTLPLMLRTYGYKTAAFYPPAVFFIDQPRFKAFEQSAFGFEYRKVEFMEGQERAEQVEQYLSGLGASEPLFLWVHLFGPHEPYESHPEHPFGARDVDRYDSEIAAADDTVGQILQAVHKRRKNPVVIVTADHGEEFGEHGGRYHGTSVYEEQVRVPLLIHAPGLLVPHRVQEPVQTIDIMPTVLDTLDIPRPPRVRGRSLRSLLATPTATGQGSAFAETEEWTLLAEGSDRLICARALGACRLYDLRSDPGEQKDQSAEDPDRFEAMRARLHNLSASHGQYEARGLRAEGKGWPAPILRGVAGDADAAPEIAALLEDADRSIRRKAAELLFELRSADTAPALRLALGRDEDPEVRAWAGLALTRLGQGAAIVQELLQSNDIKWRRLAALALAESGDKRGRALLVDWWQHGGTDDYERALQLLNAFRLLQDKDAVFYLVRSLGSVRLRPHIARTLAAIGDDSARGPLAKALADERYHNTRVALAEALVDLGADTELIVPLTRFLGTPDPLENGLAYAERAGVLDHIGGPSERGMRALHKDAHVGVSVRLVVPRAGNGSGFRALVRARTTDGQPGRIRIGTPKNPMRYDNNGMPIITRKVPVINDSNALTITVPPSRQFTQVDAPTGDRLDLKPGLSVDLVVYAERNVDLDAVAIVPLADELPPPPPEPWTIPATASDRQPASASDGIEERP